MKENDFSGHSLFRKYFHIVIYHFKDNVMRKMILKTKRIFKNSEYNDFMAVLEVTKWKKKNNETNFYFLYLLPVYFLDYSN